MVEQLVQEILPVKRIALRRPEPGIADHVAQFFFRGAIGYARRTHNVFFDHDRAYVIAAKTQSELADFEPVCDPTRLYVLKIRKEDAGNGQRLQILHAGGLVPVASTQGRVLGLKGPGDKRCKTAG